MPPSTSRKRSFDSLFSIGNEVTTVSPSTPQMKTNVSAHQVSPFAFTTAPEVNNISCPYQYVTDICPSSPQIEDTGSPYQCERDIRSSVPQMNHTSSLEQLMSANSQSAPQKNNFSSSTQSMPATYPEISSMNNTNPYNQNLVANFPAVSPMNNSNPGNQNLAPNFHVRSSMNNTNFFNQKLPAKTPAKIPATPRLKNAASIYQSLPLVTSSAPSPSVSGYSGPNPFSTPEAQMFLNSDSNRGSSSSCSGSPTKRARKNPKPNPKTSPAGYQLFPTDNASIAAERARLRKNNPYRHTKKPSWNWVNNFFANRQQKQQPVSVLRAKSGFDYPFPKCGGLILSVEQFKQLQQLQMAKKQKSNNKDNRNMGNGTAMHNHIDLTTDDVIDPLINSLPMPDPAPVPVPAQAAMAFTTPSPIPSLPPPAVAVAIAAPAKLAVEPAERNIFDEFLTDLDTGNTVDPAPTPNLELPPLPSMPGIDEAEAPTAPAPVSLPVPAAVPNTTTAAASDHIDPSPSSSAAADADAEFRALLDEFTLPLPGFDEEGGYWD